MDAPILALTLRCKRDMLQARQRGRQLAGLLGYEPREQVAIAAAVFEVAWNAFQSRGRCTLYFQIGEGVLRVVPGRVPRKARLGARAGADTFNARAVRRLLERVHSKKAEQAVPELKLERPLPAQAGPLPAEDLAWAARELSRHTPLNLFEEIHQHNQELLRLLHEVQSRQAESAPPRRPRSSVA